MILETIRALYGELTRSQRQIADYLLESYHQAVFMTASRLAEELSMNEATVIRFAQRLGYAGYPDMIDDLEEIVQRELAAESAGGAPTLMLATLDKEIQNLQRFARHIPPETASRIMDLVAEKRRLYILGHGLAHPLASIFALSLQTLGIDAHSPPTDAATLATICSDFDSQCAVVAISARGDNPQLAKTLELANKAQAGTLALSDSPTSLCAQTAQFALSYFGSSGAPLPSLAPLALLIEALVQSLTKRDAEGWEARRSRAAQAHDFITTPKER